MTIAETRRYASRQIHAFFKEYGYKAYRNSYIKIENPFAGIFQDWQVNNLESPAGPRDRLLRTDSLGDNYLKEQIVNILRRKPAGMTRAELSMYLEVPVKELQWHLEALIKDSRIIEVKREAWAGRITPLYLIAGSRVPEQKHIRTQRYELMRQAYFVEGKTTSWIAGEYHHSLQTVYRAIRSAPASAATAPTGRLAAV